jgi:hypothetical protein
MDETNNLAAHGDEVPNQEPCLESPPVSSPTIPTSSCSQVYYNSSPTFAHEECDPIYHSVYKQTPLSHSTSYYQSPTSYLPPVYSQPPSNNAHNTIPLSMLKVSNSNNPGSFYTPEPSLSHVDGTNQTYTAQNVVYNCQSGGEATTVVKTTPTKSTRVLIKFII